MCVFVCLYVAWSLPHLKRLHIKMSKMLKISWILKAVTERWGLLNWLNRFIDKPLSFYDTSNAQSYVRFYLYVLESKKIEQSGGYNFATTSIPTTFNFGQSGWTINTHLEYLFLHWHLNLSTDKRRHISRDILWIPIFNCVKFLSYDLIWGFISLKAISVCKWLYLLLKVFPCFVCFHLALD